MLDLLFEGEEDDASGKSSGGGGSTNAHKTLIAGPPPPKNLTGLSGIDNRGSTCYLNSLLQTLLLTPELRESLFQLGPDELGKLDNKDTPGAKVRVIPIELQRLFARLLYQDQESCSTESLTSSFGWSNNEHSQQHDVQELNRILFSALEDSLVGTSGQNVISELYHGTIVNKIVCEKCGKASEREEDFLDLTLPITGFVGVSDTLRAMYEETELMAGSNQYRCSSCQTLVDAKKGAKLRKLPPILTLSLLRFSYDFRRGERYKETGHYTFPLELDMKSYCEKVQDDSDSTYELFSVVIHSGSTHGGHYRAYIRDIDGIGIWFDPEESPITLKTDPLEGRVDFIEISSPQQLLKTLLQKYAADGPLPVDKLCQVLMSETGVSWNKRYKRQYGPITKFVKRYDDIFLFSPVDSKVSLKDPFDSQSVGSSTPNTSSSASPTRREAPSTQNARAANAQESLSQNPVPGHCWFDFNDSRVQPIHGSAIQKQFNGKESAYMLFYRKKSMLRQNKGETKNMESLPLWLLQEMQEANEDLRIQREIHDLTVNEIKIYVLQSHHYEWRSGALQPNGPSEVSPKCVSLDRRKPVTELKTAVLSACDDLSISTCCLSIAKKLPAGVHLYECLTENESAIIRDVGVTDGSYVFVWDGEQVDGMPIRTGPDAQPILLRLSYLDQFGTRREMSVGYPQSTSLRTLFEAVAVLTDIPEESLALQRMTKDGRPAKLDRTEKSICEEGIEDGDDLVAEEEAGQDNGLGKRILPALTQELQKQVSLTVVNKCLEQDKEGEWPVMQISVTKDKTLRSLKRLILSKFSGVDLSPDWTRLRLEDDAFGLQPPLHEDQTVENACTKKKSHLVFEIGEPPKSNEITVTFALNTDKGTKTWEVLLDRDMSCSACLEKVIVTASLESKDYHLCKTNWCWEEQRIVTELDHSLEEERVQDGDYLLLKEGRLPPKGFIRCPVWLYPTPQQGFIQTQSEGSTEPALWMQQQSQGIIDSLLNMKQKAEIPGDSDMAASHHALLGNVEVPHDTKVEDLKHQILTLPAMAQVSIPTVHFMRLRLMVRGRLGKVLSGNQTLRQLKVTSSSHLAVQLLSHEEHLKPSAILLQVCQRIPNTRTYTPPEDFVWDTARGPSPVNLKQTLSESTSIPFDQLVLAKKIPEKFQWMVILSTVAFGGERAQRGKRKGKVPDVNLKQSPYNLRDGDVIAIKDSQLDPLNQDNFTTEEDDIGQLKLQEELEKKKRLRKEKKLLGGEGQKRRQREEVGLSIKVEDFSR